MAVTYKSYSKLVIGKLRQDVLLKMAKEAEELFLNPAKVLVPLDTGDLENSGAVTKTSNAVYVSFGRGESAKYAVDQHENLFYRHLPGRQAKYLEQPFRENAEEFLKRMREL